ncbi:MAG: hypothetical protein EOP88_13795 [Verrucomicrobiaceae bacterium]|nr:MAG: hypothetical protein EOP88_13795 [Verrucomicrobiaceae bacterium]
MRTAAIITLILALCCLGGAFVSHRAECQTGARMHKSIRALHETLEPPAASDTSSSPPTAPPVDIKLEVRSLRWNGIKSLHIQQSMTGLFLMGTAVFSFSTLALMLASLVRDGRRTD